MDATLTEKEFSKFVNTKFRAKVDADKEVPLELIEVKGYTSTHAEQQGMERFSIFFVGPEDQPLQQTVYAFAHDEMGEFDLFLVPLTPNESGRRYEAVFNYFAKPA